MTDFYFNFTGESYSSPTGSGSFAFEFAGSGTECLGEWIDSEYDHWPLDPNIAWGECSDPFTYLNQIWHDDNYVYAATTDGLNIIDMISELAYAHITYDGGFNSVWADDNNVYLATPASGIKYIEKTCISGTELVQHLQSHLTVPDILSNKVRYIHGNGNYMVICSASGVDVRGADPYYESATTGTKYSRKCFMTSIGKFYYTTYDGTWRVNRVDKVTTDWAEPDEYYETGTYYINAGVDLLDIFVTENTSETGIDNTIFIATTSGIFVIDEENEASDTYYTA